MTAPAVPDLAARILEAIDETERIAREAAKTNTGRWTSGSPYGYGTVVQDDAGELVVYLNRGLNGRAAYIARNDPESVLRRCAAGRDLIADVQAWTHHTCEDSYYSCPQAVLPGCVDPCDCGTEDRRRQVLHRLAEVYAITVETP